ncbi:MAG: protein kinase [Leptolyngbyaceae cyanobacterium]
MQWTPGQRLQNGKYTITKVLGEGGFGMTYLADSQEYGQVVIKTVNETVQKRSDFDEFQTDFMNEALKIRGCQHRHIVKVHKLFQEKVRHPNPGNNQSPEISLFCMVMEFVAGIDLAERVIQQGRLSETDALRYVCQVGEALSVVHDNGLLHRDVKPNNIMVRQATDEAVLIDFGIAREFTPNATQTHTKFLSDGFAPIEQYDQRTKRGAFTDVYALAATLYCLVTGEVPSTSQTRMLELLQYQRDKIEPPKALNPALSDQVNAAIMKGMALRPEYRPQTMAEWLELLGIKIGPPPPVNPPLPPPVNPPPPPPVNPPPSPPINPLPPSSPVVSLSRRSWLKWASLGGVGIVIALLVRPWELGGETDSASSLDRMTLDQEAVEVDSEGTIVRSYPVTVDTYVEDLGNGVQFRMVRIPGGRFEMGSPPDEEGRFEREGPQHFVDVPTFFMGMTTVTQAVYEAVMGENPSHFQGRDRPVEDVSWNDAIAFCQKLESDQNFV